MKILSVLNIKENKIKYIAIIIFGLLNAMYLMFYKNVAVMEFITHNITDKYKMTVGAFCNLFPFSLAEVIVACFIIFCVYILIKSVVGTIKAKGKRIAFVYKQFLIAVIIALSVSTALTFFWGINYYAESAVEKMGVSAKPISVEDLTHVTMLFAQMLNESAQNVERNEDGLLNVSRDEVYDAAHDLYLPLEEQYPFLQGPAVTPKKMMFSWYMDMTNYTGIFFPFTGEANINKNQPLCLLPAVIAHELAHVRGVAPEQDCNFIAVLACEYSDNDVYKYSGRLFAYIYLSNSLYSANSELAMDIYNGLDDGVKADLADHSLYWQQFESPAADVANSAYDNFLQSYGQDDGIKSYGRVTDLLCDKYIEQAREIYN